MLNILIKESDLLFQSGLTSFLSELFIKEFKQELNFKFDLTRDNVRSADIVVLSLCHGECFTCFPELRSRQKGIVIGLVDDELRVSAAPSCFQDIVFISRRASLSQVRLALFTAWKKTQLPEYQFCSNSCFDCQHKTLSPQQIRIMGGLYNGMSVVQIADQLMISDKTVFTHKYIMMQKFKLRTDFELVTLLKKMAEKNIIPTLFGGRQQNNIKDRYVADSFTC